MRTLLAGVALVGGLIATTLTVGAAGAPTTTPTTASSFPPCKVTLSATATSATATIVSGCVGDFVFVSYVGIRTGQVFDTAEAPPYQVNLPVCGPWQVDFTDAADPGNRHLYAFKVGDNGTCPPPTTTTTTVTLPPPIPTTSTTTTSTTTTTQPSIPTTNPTGPNICVSCLPAPSPVNVTQEQQQLTQGLPSGVTRGSG